jgi:hypothetical protein
LEILSKSSANYLLPSLDPCCLRLTEAIGGSDPFDV